MNDSIEDIDELCTVCNERSGTYQHVELTDHRGEQTHLELILCPECIAAFEQDKLTTVTPLPEERLADR